MRRGLSLSDLRSLADLHMLFWRHRFAFVQTHTQKASLLGLGAARCAGLPTLYTMHGCLVFKENSFVQNLLGWIFERWLRVDSAGAGPEPRGRGDAAEGEPLPSGEGRLRRQRDRLRAVQADPLPSSTGERPGRGDDQPARRRERVP